MNLELKENHVEMQELDGDHGKMQERQENLILEEVAPDRQLVQEMEKFLPHSYQMVSMLLVHLQFQHFPLMNARVFIPRCALYRYKMVGIKNVATVNDRSSMSLFWSKDHLSNGDVCQLLRSLPDFSWTGRLFIRQLPIHLHQNLDHIIRELSEDSLAAEWALPVVICTLGNSVHEVPSLPEGYYAGPLRKIHGQQVLTGWIGSHGENLDNFSRILEKLPAVGIFKERKASPKHQKLSETTESVAQSCSSVEFNASTTDSGTAMTNTAGKTEYSIFSLPRDKSTGKLNIPANASITMIDKVKDDRVANFNDETNEPQDELVGWCLLKHGADIGMLYTTKGHRKLGLAKVATLELTRQVLDNKLNAFIMVPEENTFSITMHEKLGFEKYTTDIILMYSPKKCYEDVTSGEVLN